MKNIFLLMSILLFFSCKRDVKAEDKAINKKVVPNSDTILISKKHKVNTITCDLDGDKKNETVTIVQSTQNKKTGLKIQFGNGTATQYFGMGTTVLNQGFDDLNWVGIFEKAPKNEIYWNNVAEDGTLLSEEEIKEEDKIKLPNDGLFIHAKEQCGGGIIYMENGTFKWIQQE